MGQGRAEVGSREWGLADPALIQAGSSGRGRRFGARWAEAIFTIHLHLSPFALSADQLAELFEQGGCDGFVISPAYLPGSFTEFVESVIPHLQRKGLFRKTYEGATLREHLGLGELSD